jgi:hypothetical protein
VATDARSQEMLGSMLGKFFTPVMERTVSNTEISVYLNHEFSTFFAIYTAFTLNSRMYFIYILSTILTLSVIIHSPQFTFSISLGQDQHLVTRLPDYTPRWKRKVSGATQVSLFPQETE